MRHDRLHSLTDAIFAIAMTLLVFNLKVPILSKADTDSHPLWHALTQLTPELLSFILSFAVLFIYWRAHNFIVSNLAQNIDVPLTNINALFLLLIVFLPFNAELLGLYYSKDAAILLYGVNVIAISCTLIFMQYYIRKADTIGNNPNWTNTAHLDAYIRMAVPAVCAVLAIIIGLWNKDAALILFTLTVILGFSRTSVTLVRRIISRLPLRRT